MKIYNFVSIFISCEEIPEIFLDKLTAKKYFSKFGKINRFILRPKRMSCTVEYDTALEAKQALASGGSFYGVPFLIKYAQQDLGHIRNTEEWIDPEVQSELEAMSNSDSYSKDFSGTIPRLATNNQNLLYSNPATNTKILTINKELKASNYFSSSLNTSKVIKVVQSNVMNNNSTGQVAHVDSTLRQELEAILRKPAISNEEKYRILDTRDKLVRLTMVKQTDIKKVVATKGTCPDMCPEKERLMREFQRQVRKYLIMMKWNDGHFGFCMYFLGVKF